MKGFRRPSRRVSRGLQASFAIAAICAAAPAAASASVVDATYSCDGPGFGPVPLTVKVDAPFPAQIERGLQFKAPPSTVTAELGTGAIAGTRIATVEGSILGDRRFEAPKLPDLGGIASMYAPFPKTTLDRPSEKLVLQASEGAELVGSYSQVGTYKIRLGAIYISVLGRDASGTIVRPPGGNDYDSDPQTFQLDCFPVPAGTQPLLASIDVIPSSGTIEPVRVVEANVTATTATICWPGASADEGPTTFVVKHGDTVLATATSGFCAPITGLEPSTQYSIDVLRSHHESEPIYGLGSTEFTTLAAPALVDYSYAVQGSATLKSLIKGSIPLKGSIAAKLNPSTGAFAGDLALTGGRASLTALGFAPVTAEISLQPTEPVTGTLIAGVLKANAKVRVKVDKLLVFGVPMFAGVTCRTKQVSSIALRSSQPEFLPEVGGPLSGQFAITDLAGCGGLNGVISALTAGKNNVLSVNLTPKP